MPSSIESVASFSVVLAETFAAVGLSTLVPNAFIALTKAAKGGGAAISDIMLTNAKIPGAVEAAAIMKGAAASLDSMDILLPKDAKIHAEFEFQGSDKMTGDVSAGGQIEMVSVKAGFSAMYESKSSNKIALDVSFHTVHVGLGMALPGKPTNINVEKADGKAIIFWDSSPEATDYTIEGDPNLTAQKTRNCFYIVEVGLLPLDVTVTARNVAGSTKSEKTHIS